MILGLYIFSNYDHIRYSRLSGRINQFVGCDSTCYSADYNEKNFRLITVGMSFKKVLESLGAPIFQKSEDDIMRLWYTKSCSDSDYQFRMIEIDQVKAAVRKVHRYYYFD